MWVLLVTSVASRRPAATQWLTAHTDLILDQKFAMVAETMEGHTVQGVIVKQDQRRRIIRLGIALLEKAGLVLLDNPSSY